MMKNGSLRGPSPLVDSHVQRNNQGISELREGLESVFIPWDYVTAKHCPERVQPWAEEMARLLKRLSQKCEGLSLLPRIQVKKKKKKKTMWPAPERP